MARLCVAAARRWRWELAIAHCDHRWRQDSSANAEFVAQQAVELGLPFFLATANTVVNSEAMAREWRYRVLAEIAQKHQFAYVVTGHTLSDQAETVLYNLIRGTGSEGLAGIAPRRPLADGVHLVRPLLKISREETGGFCRERGIPIWWDGTNDDLAYRRNHLRAHVVPYLREYFNSQVESAIAQTAELLAADSEYLATAAAQAFTALTVNSFPLQLLQSALLELPLALQRRVVRLFLQTAMADGGTYAQVESVRVLLPQARGRTPPLIQGLWAEVRGDRLFWGQEVYGEKDEAT